MFLYFKNLNNVDAQHRSKFQAHRIEVNIKTFGGFCAQELNLLAYIHLEVKIWGITSHWKSQSIE